MTLLPNYLSDVAKAMAQTSQAIRRDFATHRPSAGDNREGIVEEFLIKHLPKRFGISTGLVFSQEGVFSHQADLLVVDDQNNACLYPNSPNKLWPVEAVYALIEVKTTLTLPEIKDAVAKCRRFKRLKRTFGKPVNINDSLFAIWAYDSPDISSVKANLIECINGVPTSERPDLVVVLNKATAMMGSYLEVTRVGLSGSEHRNQLNAKYGPDLSHLLPEVVEMNDVGEHALLNWYIWFESWLRYATPRFSVPSAYLPIGGVYGKKA